MNDFQLAILIGISKTSILITMNPRRHIDMKLFINIAIYYIFAGMFSATSAYSRVEELESQINELSTLIQLYEAKNSRSERQASTLENVINENRKCI